MSGEAHNSPQLQARWMLPDQCSKYKVGFVDTVRRGDMSIVPRPLYQRRWTLLCHLPIPIVHVAYSKVASAVRPRVRLMERCVHQSVLRRHKNVSPGSLRYERLICSSQSARNTIVAVQPTGQTPSLRRREMRPSPLRVRPTPASHREFLRSRAFPLFLLTSFTSPLAHYEGAGKSCLQDAEPVWIWYGPLILCTHVLERRWRARL